MNAGAVNSPLLASLADRVYTPADAGYAPEIAGFNTAVVHTPEIVVAASSAADVAATVRFAREHGHRVSVQAPGTAHMLPSPRACSSPPDDWTP